MSRSPTKSQRCRETVVTGKKKAHTPEEGLETIRLQSEDRKGGTLGISQQQLQAGALHKSVRETAKTENGN